MTLSEFQMQKLILKQEIRERVQLVNEFNSSDKVKIFLEEKIKSYEKGIASKSVADVIIKQTNI